MSLEVYNRLVLRSAPRRGWLAIAVSLAIHAAALALLWRPASPTPLTSGLPSSLEVEVRWTEPTQPATPAPPKVARLPAGAPGRGQASSVARPSLAPASEAPWPSDAPLAARRSLLPSPGATISGPEDLSQRETRGVTVLNHPMDRPDPQAFKEYQEEVLSRQLTQELAQQLAAAATSAGRVPPVFRQAEAALRNSLETAPLPHTPLPAGDLLKDLAGVVLTPGVSAEAADRVARTPGGRSTMTQAVPLPTMDDQRFREAALQTLAVFEAFKERASRPRLRTVLEIITDASGAVAEATVVERSGDVLFDESALHLSRKVFRELPENDDRRLGTTWWRTRWQFSWEPPRVRVRLLEAAPIAP